MPNTLYKVAYLIPLFHSNVTHLFVIRWINTWTKETAFAETYQKLAAPVKSGTQHSKMLVLAYVLAAALEINFLTAARVLARVYLSSTAQLANFGTGTDAIAGPLKNGALTVHYRSQFKHGTQGFSNANACPPCAHPHNSLT